MKLVYIYIYIYKERERVRERESKRKRAIIAVKITQNSSMLYIEVLPLEAVCCLFWQGYFNSPQKNTVNRQSLRKFLNSEIIRLWKQIPVYPMVSYTSNVCEKAI